MKFTLLNDHAPIHYSKCDMNSFPKYSVGFVCPLPLGYLKIVEEQEQWLYTETVKMIKEVEVDVVRRKGSFINIMGEYSERSKSDQKKLRHLFQFSHILFQPKRGLTAIHAGNDVNSGDIYLDSNASMNYCDFSISGFKEYFEPQHAWFCHNVDNYWQALMDREVTVRYFNLLQDKLFYKEIRK